MKCGVYVEACAPTGLYVGPPLVSTPKSDFGGREEKAKLQSGNEESITDAFKDMKMYKFRYTKCNVEVADVELAMFGLSPDL